MKKKGRFWRSLGFALLCLLLLSLTMLLLLRPVRTVREPAALDVPPAASVMLA